MPSQVTMIYKLQRALQRKGYLITISSYQLYKEEIQGFIKIYSVSHGRETVIKTTSVIKIVKYLADCLKIISEEPEIINLTNREQNDIMSTRCRKW